VSGKRVRLDRPVARFFVRRASVANGCRLSRTIATQRKCVSTRRPYLLFLEICLAERSKIDQANPPASLPLDFEVALAELEGLVASMEDGSLPLAASLEAYRRGVDLSRVCQERLMEAEQQVKVLEGDLLRPMSAPASAPDSE
jgi:exodeoxyribonuclease VII small subunit